jgi:hypothetical protein
MWYPHLYPCNIALTVCCMDSSIHCCKWKQSISGACFLQYVSSRILSYYLKRKTSMKWIVHFVLDFFLRSEFSNMYLFVFDHCTDMLWLAFLSICWVPQLENWSMANPFKLLSLLLYRWCNYHVVMLLNN